MDLNCGLDGVYAGRFVLVEYDSEVQEDSFKDFYCDESTMYTAAETKQSLLDSKVSIITNFLEVNKVLGGTVTQDNVVTNKTIAIVRPYRRRFNANKNVIYVKNLGFGKFLEVTEEDYNKYKDEKGLSYNPENLTTDQTYIVNGILQVLSQDYNKIGNILPVKKGNSYSTNTTESFWMATVSATTDSNGKYTIVWKELSASDTTYVKNHSIDIAWYGDSRGFDSTVWQKVYSSGSEKYVMVAELNTVVPTFAMSADAPTMSPIVPHFDTDNTNVYYKVHWQSQWGIRMKAAKFDLDGEQIDQNGNIISNKTTRLTSDGVRYPSDQKTKWRGDFYSTKTNERSVKYYNQEKGSWTVEDVGNVDAAVYFNKAGFDPKTISYSTDLKESGQNNYSVEFKNWDGLDKITLAPTGLSGNIYNPHDGTIDLTPMEDVQEFSIMLPSVGDTMAKVWDLVYGDRDTSDEIKRRNTRNTDIAWEDAKSTLNRSGLRLTTDDYGINDYNKASVDTLAGAINTAHDAIGMIITKINNKALEEENSIATKIDENRIYYNSDTRKYLRKHKTYDYKEVAYVYDYIAVNIDSDQTIDYSKYYAKKGDEYVQAQEGDSPLYEKIKTYSNDSEYTLVEKFNSFPTNDKGEVYRYLDYTGTINDIPSDADPLLYADYIFDEEYINGKTYYVVEKGDKVKLTAEYSPKTYWYHPLDKNDKELAGYTLDTGESVTGNRIYYKYNPENAKKLTDCGYNGIYIPNSYYYAKYIEIIKNKDNSNGMTLDELKNNLRKGVKYFHRDGSEQTSAYIEIRDIKDEITGTITTAEDLLTEVYNADNRYIFTASYHLDNNENASNDLYYSVASEKIEDGNRYTVTIKYNLVENPDESNYIKGMYYIQTSNGIYQQYFGDLDPENKTSYYIKTEQLNPVSNTVTLNVDDPLSLITFKENTFFTYSFEESTGSKSYTAVKRTDIDPTKKDVVYYVLGYDKNNSSSPFELANMDDSLKAFVQQNEFYQPNKYHYEDDNHSYLLATSKSYMDKGENGYFYIKTPKEVTGTFYAPYEYYKKGADGEYTLVTTPKAPTNTELYKRNALYVMEDQANIYSKGAIWNPEAKIIPPTVQIGTRSERWELIELEGFAKNLNTQNGLILKTNKILEYNDDLTRDTRTVNGCVNYLQDIIARFHKMIPGQVMVVDSYGRLHSAKHEGDDWLKITVDSNVNEPKIILNHRQKTVDETAKSGTDLNNPKKDTITIQDITFDTTGHVQTNQEHTYILPYGFKTIKTNGVGSNTNDMTANKNNIIADNTQDILTINSYNQWIKIANDTDNDTMVIAHEIHNVDEADKSATDLNNPKKDTITLKDITFDKAGHVKTNQSHEYILPYGFKYIKTNGRGSNITENATGTPTTTTVEADNTQDTLALNSGNKWIRIDTVDGTTNSLTFSHDIHTITTSTSTVDFNESGNTFSIPTLSYDEAGHITSKATCTYTLPNSFKTFKIYKGYDTTTSDDIKEIVASGILDTLSIQPNNKWITLDVDSENDHKLVIKHMELRKEDESRGETTDQYPTFGKTFRALSVKVDKAGHVIDLASHTVTIPLPSLTDEDEGNVVTDLTLNASAGAFTESKNYIGKLAITGFEKTYTGTRTTLLDQKQTLNSALAILEKAILEETDSRTTAISNLGSMATENADNYLTKETIENTYIASNTQFTYQAPTEDESDPNDKFDNRDKTVEWLFQKVAQLEKIVNELQLAKA
jgi:hypothetical protein